MHLRRTSKPWPRWSHERERDHQADARGRGRAPSRRPLVPVAPHADHRRGSRAAGAPRPVTTFLDLGDYIEIAVEVTGWSRTTVERVAKLNLADSALHAPAAGFGDQDHYPD